MPLSDSERAETIALLREACHRFGDNNWSDELALNDIIEKHLLRHVWLTVSDLLDACQQAYDAISQAGSVIPEAQGLALEELGRLIKLRGRADA